MSKKGTNHKNQQSKNGDLSTINQGGQIASKHPSQCWKRNIVEKQNNESEEEKKRSNENIELGVCLFS